MTPDRHPVGVDQVHAKAILYSKFERNRTKTVGGDRFTSWKHEFRLSYDLYLTPDRPPRHGGSSTC